MIVCCNNVSAQGGEGVTVPQPWGILILVGFIVFIVLAIIGIKKAAKKQEEDQDTY